MDKLNCPLQKLKASLKDETGSSLLEILVAVAIITVALTLLISALSTGALAVRSADRLTAATNLSAVQLETIKAAGYVTGTAAYPTIPSGAYVIDQEINYWNGTSFSPAPGADSGMQRIIVTVAYDSDVLLTVENYKVNR
jgi:type II secretory pathway pseudopilin PulG